MKTNTLIKIKTSPSNNNMKTNTLTKIDVYIIIN